MAEVVNLNKVRKLRNKVKHRQQADVNSVKFGQSLVEKRTKVLQKSLEESRLDGHKRETDD